MKYPNAKRLAVFRRKLDERSLETRDDERIVRGAVHRRRGQPDDDGVPAPAGERCSTGPGHDAQLQRNVRFTLGRPRRAARRGAAAPTARRPGADDGAGHDRPVDPVRG